MIYFQSPLLFVKNLEATRRFYEMVLGQKMRMDTGLNIGFIGGFAICQEDHTHRRIFTAPPLTQPMLRFQVQNLSAICEKLRAEKIIVFEYTADKLSFRDLDENLVELIETLPTQTAIMPLHQPKTA